MKHSQERYKIGLFTTISVVMGCMIGSGIFKKPAIMAAQLASPGLLILAWALSGLFTFFGAVSSAEVSSMFPETGGQFVYFEKMFGKFFAYLYGWACFSVIQTGSVAGMAYIFAEYLQFFLKLPRLERAIETAYHFYLPGIGTFYPLEFLGLKAMTVAIIFFLTVVNYRGVKWGGIFQLVFTTLKLSAIFLLVILAFVKGTHSVTGEGALFPDINTSSIFPLITILMTSMAGAFWAYDGWMNATFIAGEIKDPQKNLPRALMTGTFLVTLIYVIVNVAYLKVLTITQMSTSHLVASDVMTTLAGAGGGAFIAAAILVSTFGSTNGSVLSSSRVYLAMAERGVFFKTASHIHPKYFSPHRSLIYQFLWAIVLVFSGTFDQLTDMLVFVAWVFYFLAVLGVFIFRYKYPDLPRPYRAWGYPFTPILFLLFAGLFVGMTLVHDISQYLDGKTPIITSVFGIGLVLLGTPLYWYFQRTPQKEAKPRSQ